MPPVGCVEDPCDMEEIGMLPGSAMRNPYAARWDRRPGYDGCVEDPCDDIGEDPSGVWIAVHPIVMLAGTPRIWGVVHEWHAGVRDVSLDYYDSRSHLEVEAKNEMVAAYTRMRDRAREVVDVR